MNLPRPREKDVQAAIRDYLESRGAFPIRTNSGAVKGAGRFVRFNDRPGCSDLIVAYKGRFLALEVKRDARAKATEKQSAFLAEVRERGKGVAEVVCRWEDVRDILDRIDAELEGRE